MGAGVSVSVSVSVVPQGSSSHTRGMRGVGVVRARGRELWLPWICVPLGGDVRVGVVRGRCAGWPHGGPGRHRGH